jgi:TonB family protein
MRACRNLSRIKHPAAFAGRTGCSYRAELKRSLLLPGVLLALLIVLGTDRCLAIAQQPQVFTGPDVGRYFVRIWVPTYPWTALKNRIGGRGTYRAYVEPDGKVTKVVVIKSAGLRELDDAVISAGLGWRAKPGKKREIDFPMAFLPPPR